MYVKQGRFGPYVQLGEVTDDSKPKTASLFREMKPEAVTLEQALELLRLPRVVGTAEDGEVVTAQNGRYGPYITKGKDSRNLGPENEAKLLSITLEEALEIFKQPKQFRGRGQPKAPLKVFGNDPVSGKEMVLKEGRFGFYVTDGETNATLRKGDEPGELTVERAVELLQARREYDASAEGQARAAARGARKAGKAKAGKASKSKSKGKPKEKPEKPEKMPQANAAKVAKVAKEAKTKPKAKEKAKKSASAKKTPGGPPTKADKKTRTLA